MALMKTFEPAGIRLTPPEQELAATLGFLGNYFATISLVALGLVHFAFDSTAIPRA